jgi:hypothetical protein
MKDNEIFPRNLANCFNTIWLDTSHFFTNCVAILSYFEFHGIFLGSNTAPGIKLIVNIYLLDN